jgi:hypothetical protein
MESRTRLTRNESSVSHACRKAHRANRSPFRGVPWLEPHGRGPPVPGQRAGLGKSHDEGNERVTWEDCPNCPRAAAVGWLNGRPVEYDCPRGCCLNAEQVQAFDARHGRRPVDWLAARFVSAWPGVRLKASLMASLGRGYPQASH